MKISFLEPEKFLDFQGNNKVRQKHRNIPLSNNFLPYQSWHGLGDPSTRVVSRISGSSSTRYLPNTVQSPGLKPSEENE